jgi:class 3 adenylate cyclase
MQYPVVAVGQPDRVPMFLSIQQPIMLGRDCDGCVLVDPQVSRCHLKLEPHEGRVMVTDMGSTNGTFLDGARIDSPVMLLSGSVIMAGQTRVTLAQGDDTTQLIAAKPRSAPRGATVPTGSAGRETSIDLVAAAVRDELTDLSVMQDDAGTVTIVFSDIEGSTERALALGDGDWMKVLEVHNRLVRRHVAAFGGTEIKSQGDGFMLSFPGARRAVLAMIEIQRDLARQAKRDPDRAVRVRMGCHTGEVILDGLGDMFGKHVIVAARIANLAHGSEILVSDLVKELVSSRGDVNFENSRTVDLKGIDGPWEVHRVEWA